VHIPLRRPQVGVPGELLNIPCRRAPHREMRTERVPKNVTASVREFRRARRVIDVVADDLLTLVLKR
jgi:hypothetical protein